MTTLSIFKYNLVTIIFYCPPPPSPQRSEFYFTRHTHTINSDIVKRRCNKKSFRPLRANLFFFAPRKRSSRQAVSIRSNLYNTGCIAQCDSEGSTTIERDTVGARSIERETVELDDNRARRQKSAIIGSSP